jgi:prepilin-type N-terminal cleavage/methylation domain-containing protein
VKGSRRAFTLPEVLVVLAIILIVTSILTPVFLTARNAAKGSVCLNNFHQGFIATSLYLNDYDDTYMPVNHQPASEPNSKNDRTWVQMIMPYTGDYGIFRCPADDSDRPRREATFDQDLVPGDTYSQYYTASLRTNLGYNFVYFSPIFQLPDQWVAEPRIADQVQDPSDTFLFIDSVWALDKNGEPTGGGSWLVVPPCRFDEDDTDTFTGSDPSIKTVFTNDADGWDVGKLASPLQYGCTWPWHAGKTRMTTVTASGTAKTYTPSELVKGCDVQPSWNGRITQADRYEWDLR